MAFCHLTNIRITGTNQIEVDIAKDPYTTATVTFDRWSPAVGMEPKPELKEKQWLKLEGVIEKLEALALEHVGWEVNEV